MTTTAKTNITAIIPEMEAQVARELPEPAGFASETERRTFESRRLTRLFDLAKDIQWFLNTHCADDVERQMALDAYRDQSHLLLTRN